MNAREFLDLQDAYQGVYQELDEEAPEKITKPTKNPKLMKTGGPARVHNPNKMDEEIDVFTQVLEYLVAEGYADTNENALAIMANMSEEWKQSIVEEEKPYPEEKVNAKIQKVKKKEEIAIHQRNPQEADKQYKRSIALRFKKKMSDIGRG
jgi:hypothetical protein